MNQTALSFRDPAGHLLLLHGRIIRFVHAAGIPDLEAFLRSAAAQRFTDAGRLVTTAVVDAAHREHLLADFAAAGGWFEGESPPLAVEHERIRFPSFPYEWAPSMLQEAGRLTLDLAEAALADGFGLKDATPFNILFRGSRPVFIDLLSFERRDPGDPVWLPYAPFVRNFLLPLLANRHFGIRLDQIFLTRRDGLEPDEVYRLCSPLQRLRPSFLSLVSIPTWLNRYTNSWPGSSLYRKKSLDNPEKVRFILRSLFGRLRCALDRLAPGWGESSAWSDYGTAYRHSLQHLPIKQAFLANVMQAHKPRMVLDVGCNTGQLSAVAAQNGACVVAIDADPVVVGAAWRRARADNLDILPLVVDLTRPPPAVGWCNREVSSFLDRARGAFDAVLMLAILHHLLVTERIPLDAILGLAAELTSDLLIIEFIGPDDPLFQRLTRGRAHLHADLTRDRFEAASRRYFEILGCVSLEGTGRYLYTLRKKRNAGGA